MDKNIPLFSGSVLLLVILTVVGCVPGKRLMPSEANPAEMTGNYTLLLYGCHYASDVKNAAFFIEEGGKYPLEIFDLNTSYKTIKGLTVQQALAKAESFLKCSSYTVWQTVLRKIPDDSGGTIGYEMRPLYIPYQLGKADVLDITYFLKNAKIRAYIMLDKDVERSLEAAGDSHRSGNSH
jgi:hypothetical protein